MACTIAPESGGQHRHVGEAIVDGVKHNNHFNGAGSV